MIRLTEEAIREYCAGGAYQSESYYRDGAEAQLKKVVEWGNEDCPHTHNPNYFKLRRFCEDCWQALLEEI